jgi:hypothetical protein
LRIKVLDGISQIGRGSGTLHGMAAFDIADIWGTGGRCVRDARDTEEGLGL